MASKRYNSRELTNHLRELAAEAHDMLEEGTVITRGEALARLLWQKALGYVERKIDDEGVAKEVVHEPASWAIQMVYERMEGRTPQSLTEDATKIKAADRVSELAKTRINQLTAKATNDKGPPPFKAKP